MGEHAAYKFAQVLLAEGRKQGMPSDAIEGIRHVTDTDYGHPCYLAWEGDGWAIVVYEDEPDCQVATGNHVDRFVDIRP